MTWRDFVALRWRRPAAAPPSAAVEAAADLVEIFKGARRLELKREGDGRTPEGDYRIDARNPQSAFHLSLRVSYPDASDKAQAAKLGVPPGGDIYIHGLPNGLRKLFVRHPARDWTTGCIAVTDGEIREIWSLVPTGARVVIHP